MMGFLDLMQIMVTFLEFFLGVMGFVWSIYIAFTWVLRGAHI